VTYTADIDVCNNFPLSHSAINNL